MCTTFEERFEQKMSVCMKVRSRYQQWLQSQERQSPVMFILRKEKRPSEAEITDHMPEEGSISLMFTAEKTRPVESGWEIKSGGHIYMFALPSVAVILFPTDTITSRFSFPPQMKRKHLVLLPLPGVCSPQWPHAQVQPKCSSPERGPNTSDCRVPSVFTQ